MRAENADALCDGLVKLAEDPALYEQYRSNALAGAKNYDRSELARKMLRVLESLRK